MQICVITVSLLSISSTYLFSTSLVASYFLEFCHAYVSDVVLNCFSFALGDCLRTSNSLSVGEFDNEKSYHVYRLMSHFFLMLFLFISICLITFQFFIRFAVVSQIQCGFESKLEKEQKRKILPSMPKWCSPCVYGTHHCPSLPCHLMTQAMVFIIIQQKQFSAWVQFLNRFSILFSLHFVGTT